MGIISSVSSIIWTLLIGIAAGWLSGQIIKGRGFDLWTNLIVGVIGSFIGSVLFSLIGLSAYGLIGNLIVSTVGAVVLLVVLRKLKT